MHYDRCDLVKGHVEYQLLGSGLVPDASDEDRYMRALKATALIGNLLLVGLMVFPNVGWSARTFQDNGGALFATRQELAKIAPDGFEFWLQAISGQPGYKLLTLSARIPRICLETPTDSGRLHSAKRSNGSTAVFVELTPGCQTQAPSDDEMKIPALTTTQMDLDHRGSTEDMDNFKLILNPDVTGELTFCGLKRGSTNPTSFEGRLTECQTIDLTTASADLVEKNSIRSRQNVQDALDQRAEIRNRELITEALVRYGQACGNYYREQSAIDNLRDLLTHEQVKQLAAESRASAISSFNSRITKAETFDDVVNLLDELDQIEGILRTDSKIEEMRLKLADALLERLESDVEAVDDWKKGTESSNIKPNIRAAKKHLRALLGARTYKSDKQEELATVINRASGNAFAAGAYEKSLEFNDLAKSTDLASNSLKYIENRRNVYSRRYKRCVDQNVEKERTSRCNKWQKKVKSAQKELVAAAKDADLDEDTLDDIESDGDELLVNLATAQTPFGAVHGLGSLSLYENQAIYDNRYARLIDQMMQQRMMQQRMMQQRMMQNMGGRGGRHSLLGNRGLGQNNFGGSPARGGFNNQSFPGQQRGFFR